MDGSGMPMCASVCVQSHDTRPKNSVGWAIHPGDFHPNQLVSVARQMVFTMPISGFSTHIHNTAEATTGTVRLARDDGGILLQIVPTLTHIDVNVNGSYYGGGGSITGSGFGDGLTTLNFGAAKLVDITRDSNGIDVYNSNHSANFSVPNGVEGGPLSVTTPGGTSAVYGLSFKIGRAHV